MASTIGIILILMGGLVMAIGYESLSNCLGMFQSNYCWNPFSRGGAGAGAFGLYAGATIAALGAIMLVGPNIARSLGKWRSAGADSKQ